jgi:hypothetical protein
VSTSETGDSVTRSLGGHVWIKVDIHVGSGPHLPSTTLSQRWPILGNGLETAWKMATAIANDDEVTARPVRCTRTITVLHCSLVLVGHVCERSFSNAGRQIGGQAWLQVRVA